MTNRKPVSVRLEVPHARALSSFSGQNKLVERGLEQLPEFKSRLLKEQEAYAKTINQERQRREDIEQATSEA